MGRSALRQTAVIGAAAAMALALSGCLQDPNEGGEAGAGLEGFVDNAQTDGDGVVSVLGAFGGTEEEAFAASVAGFEEESGIDVEYTADADFTTTIKTRVDSGDSPDIGVFPQPGGIAEFVGDRRGAADRHLPRLRRPRRQPRPGLPRLRPLRRTCVRRPDADGGQERRLLPEEGMGAGRLPGGASRPTRS